MTQDGTEKREQLVLVGEVTGAFGVRGQLKMRAFLDNPGALAKLPLVSLTPPDGPERPVRVLNARLQSPGVGLVTLEGVETREAAEALRGALLRVRADELPPLPEGEYYEWQLVGLRVTTEAGRDLGVIERVHFYPANDVYETEVAMIPAIDEVVRSVDLASGRMVVADIPGLRKDE